MFHQQQEVNSEKTLRNSIIKTCSDYLSVGHHDAEGKIRRCTDLRNSARKDGINQLKSKIVEAIDFLNDGQHNLTRLRGPLEKYEAYLRSMALIPLPSDNEAATSHNLLTR
jgi:hypothetical protein